jgi:hypothetical protein
MGMEVSFFISCPWPRTWHVWIWFITPDTIVVTNYDHVHVLSRQGRPLRNAPVGPDKSGHAEAPCLRAWSKKRHLHAHMSHQG